MTFKAKPKTNLTAAVEGYKPRAMMAGDRTWARTPGQYISGRAYQDGADETAAEMEDKWGCDRLRLLVGPELREKFDRQRYLFNQAVWHEDLEAVRRESGRMVNAWHALDRAAEAAGRSPLDRRVWEVVLEGGTVAAIVPDYGHIDKARETVDGRRVAWFTMDEIGRLLSNHAPIVNAKIIFPGATVTAVRKPDDPLSAIHDTNEPLDDPIGF